MLTLPQCFKFPHSAQFLRFDFEHTCPLFKHSVMSDLTLRLCSKDSVERLQLLGGYRKLQSTVEI
jgi:hypothetical protein